jgi:hypothetical protein
MEISAPLLYSPYTETIHFGGIRKIKLLPIRKLMKTPAMHQKAQLRIMRYVTIAIAALTVAALAVAVYSYIN